MSRKRTSDVIPGFGLSLGISLFYLSLLVVLPIATLFGRAALVPPERIVELVTDPRVLAALRLTLLCAFCAALVNAVCGLLLAWVLVRYSFPGKRIVDAMIDLPFALPTAVAGISLTTLYAKNGWLGGPLEGMGIRVAFTPLGITTALMFVGLPFVVRSVQPVLAAFDHEIEEAAMTLGASRRAVFRLVLLPALLPAVMSGFTLALARGLGEYGPVVFISGNMPMKTEILPLLIMTKLEQFDYPGAVALGAVMLALSFGLLLAANALQLRFLSRGGRAA